MMNKYVLVGFFFFVGLVILTVLTLMVDDEGNIIRSDYTRPYRTRVMDASSIDEGSFVRMSGRKVGRVVKLEYVPVEDHFEVEVTFLVKDDVFIREDSESNFKMTSLLQGTTLDISPGSPNAKRLAPNGLVKSGGGGDIFSSLAKVIGNSADGGIGRMLLGDENMNRLSAVFETLAKDGGLGRWIAGDDGYGKIGPAIDDLGALASNVRKATEGQGTLARLLNDEDMGARVDGIVTDLGGTMKDVRSFAAELEKGEGPLGYLVSDQEARQKLDNIVTSLSDIGTDLRAGKSTLSRLISDEQMGDDVAQAVSSVAKFAKGLVEGEGTLARLLNDPELYVEIKRLIGQTREAVEDAREAAPISTFSSIIFGAVQ